MAVGQCFLGSEQILGRDEGFVAQQAAEGLDCFLGPIGEVGQGALAGFVAFAPALTEEDGGRGVAVGDGFDVHGSYYAHILTIVKANMLITWEHFHRGKFGLWSNKSETYRRIWPDFFWNFGLKKVLIGLTATWGRCVKLAYVSGFLDIFKVPRPFLPITRRVAHLEVIEKPTPPSELSANRKFSTFAAAQQFTLDPDFFTSRL